MLKTTFIARASDGLIFCETFDTESTQQSMPLPLFILLLSRATQDQSQRAALAAHSDQK